jgi:transcriptional regulator with XRE-family HTH domain
MLLGKTIARLRKRRGMTQNDLASAMEVHPSLIPRWEGGQVQPRAKTLEKLANVLEVTLQELMAGDYTGLSASFTEVDDPELLEMFGQVHKLDKREREALKVFLGAILTRTQMAEVIHR